MVNTIVIDSIDYEHDDHLMSKHTVIIDKVNKLLSERAGRKVISTCVITDTDYMVKIKIIYKDRR